MNNFDTVTKVGYKICVSGGGEDGQWEIVGLNVDDDHNLVLNGTLDEVVADIRDEYPQLRLIEQDEDFALLW